MSKITKALIVLVTISSIFLCGSVVAYVASQDNYKKLYDNRQADIQRARQAKKTADSGLKANMDKANEEKMKLNRRISALETELSQLQSSLRAAQTEKIRLEGDKQRLTDVAADWTKTADKQTEMFQTTLAGLEQAKVSVIRLEKELSETTNQLFTKEAIVEMLEAEKRRLLEEKTELQERLDMQLRPHGRQIADIEPVTAVPGSAWPVRRRGLGASITEIKLNGLITAVDMKNSIAGISIGAADGVKEGMGFHVTRGSKFICDIEIMAVETEEAVGELKLVQEPPRVRDNVSTSW